MKNMWIIVLAVVLAGLQYNLWFSKNSIRAAQYLQTALRLQINKNQELRQYNEDLLLQIQRLQKTYEAIEAHARYELGMIKKNETFYQMLPSSHSSAESAHSPLS